MNADLKVQLKGYFILVKHQCDAAGEVIPGTAEHVAEFSNLITNTGLDMIGNAIDYNYVQVGSGSTAPSFTDTTLQARIASTPNQTVSTTTYNVSPEYGQMLRTWRFAAGTAAGNLSEIGIAGGTTTPLFSRALILDGNGAPTTITILASEALDCTYVLRVMLPAGDANGTANVSGTTYNYTVRPATAGTWQNLLGNGFYYVGSPNLYAFDGVLGARSAQPTGNSSGGSTVPNAYSNGTFTRSCVTTFGLTQANFGNGITAFNLTFVGFWQFGINGGANIPKTANQTLSATFNCSWTR